MRYYEFEENIIKPKKPLTPDQLRIKSMKDQVKRAQQNVKAEKARQKIKTGKSELTSAIQND